MSDWLDSAGYVGPYIDPVLILMYFSIGASLMIAYLVTRGD